MMDKKDLFDLVEKTKDIKVLYVEDDEQVRIHIKELLSTIFTNITEATNGSQALNIYEKSKFDLLITDINMPHMNGIELINHVKKITPSLPIVVISAHGEFNNIFDAILAGIDGFILKPLDIDQFLQTISKAIEKTLLEKANRKNLLILQQYQEITNKSSIISKTDPNGIITFVNKNFCDISGYTQEELIGQPHSIIRHPDNPKKLFEHLWKVIKDDKQSWQGIVKNLAKDGSTYHVKTTIKPLLDDDGNILEFIALRDDISEIMSDKKRLLTSLESKDESCLVLLQIENFDILDKFYDEKTVVKIENEFGKLILKLLPHNTIFKKIYKLGDGRFALRDEYSNILKYNIDIEKFLQLLIENTKDTTIKLENIEYDIEIIASYCHGINNVYENTKHGIEKAKEMGESLICANDLVLELHKNAQKNIDTIQMVKKALDTCKIISYFQPIIENKSKKIVKYESLVRLINEQGEVITPHFFLDISKKGTYYSKITQRVIESSFNVLHHIEHNVSINLSFLDIENSDVRKKLIQLISDPIYKSRVTFEILEDEEVKDINTVIEFIKTVKELGDVKIAIDDFGSGYSNFERLLDYNPDILKIDGSLIKNIEHDKFSRNIVETIVTFAQKQNIQTIAEFVENENIYNILTEIGIDYSQGYFFGKPEKLI